jgi:DNA-binding beta-propeller fold protein YncE
MEKNRRRLISTIATFAALGCLFAGRASAQPFLATVGAVGDVCVDPMQSACSRGTLYVVNGVTLEVQTSLDLWRGVPNTFLQKLIVDPSGVIVYAAQSFGRPSPTSRWIDVIDLRTMTKVTTYTVTGNLTAISPDGTRLYLRGPASVLEVDSATGSLLSSIPATSPNGVAIAPSGARIYVAVGTPQAPSIAVLDGTTHALVDTIPVTNFVTQLALTADGLHLYGLAPASRVFDIDTSSNTIAGVITNFGGPSSPNSLALAAGRVYIAVSFQSPGVSGGEGIAVIDIATRTFITKINVVDPFLVEVSTDGSRVWTSTFGEPRLITIDTATNQIIGRRDTTGGPLDLAAIPSRRIGDIEVDQPAAGAVVQEPFSVSGWAVDVMGVLPGPGVNTVHVWAFPADGGAPTFVGADYGRPRLDVGALFGPSFTNSGYHVTVRGLPPGAYRLIALAFSLRTGQFSIARAVPVTIRASPQLVVDTPRDGSAVSPRFTVAGWALDTAAATGAGVDAVHVWAYPDAGGSPVFAGAGVLGDSRLDVGAVFGAQFANAGYHLEVSTLAPGTYTLVVYGHSTVTGAFSVEQHVRVTIPARQPLMWIDLPAANATVSSTFSVAGWAVEFNAATGSGVDIIHIWATAPSGVATFLGAASYGGSRPDVGAWLGSQYTASGFSLAASLPPGSYTVSVYARSTETGTFRQLKTVQITVQ